VCARRTGGQHYDDKDRGDRRRHLHGMGSAYTRRALVVNSLVLGRAAC
jgi:hypothetical protein